MTSNPPTTRSDRNHRAKGQNNHGSVRGRCQQLRQPSQADGCCQFYLLSLGAFAMFFLKKAVSESPGTLRKRARGLWSWSDEVCWEVQGMVGKNREHLTKDLGAQGWWRKTAEQRRASGTEEKSFRVQRGLSRFCSRQENTDMTKIKLGKDSLYFRLVWPRHFWLNIIIHNDKFSFKENALGFYFYFFFERQNSPNMDCVGNSKAKY